MTLYILMSHAGRVVAVYTEIPTAADCEAAYGAYLGHSVTPGTAAWNCHVEKWETDMGYVAPVTVKPKP